MVRKGAKSRSKQLIFIPKCSQQPRSRHGSKPRTDFSAFLSPASLLCRAICKDGPSCTITASLIQPCQDLVSRCLAETSNFPMLQCNKYLDLRHEVSFVEVKLAPPVSSMDNCDYCAWVNPAGDISQFDDCFEERRYSSMKEFQNALKQALVGKENFSYSRQLDRSPDGRNGQGEPEQLSDKLIESSSSRTENDHLEKGRGKRKRRTKVHFDEVTCPTKSLKKLRRFRIMRYLGLTTPTGSLYSLTAYRA
ncbi:hypothetical protein GIB67_017228 [Kingdonia uniflora]|uniref:Uncharacterized protein n=1 Tax=Kingdonia uniflora TaxID=39325 RepID=A0A7J7NKV6_9MAGN|nr:hypothetical protein GIB67_017228 [Kingdonia uniflora]